MTGSTLDKVSAETRTSEEVGIFHIFVDVIKQERDSFAISGHSVEGMLVIRKCRNTTPAVSTFCFRWHDSLAVYECRLNSYGNMNHSEFTVIHTK